MSISHELAMRLRAAYLTMHRRTNVALAELELTADQFVVLTALVETDGVTQATLVVRTGSDPNTISGMLSRLERRALIRRQRHATDGRARMVSLTEQGRRVQRQSWEASVPLRDQLRELFKPAELRVLVENLDRIARAMTSVETPTMQVHRDAACDRSSPESTR